jgi:hypothetical protein
MYQTSRPSTNDQILLLAAKKSLLLLHYILFLLLTSMLPPNHMTLCMALAHPLVCLPLSLAAPLLVTPIYGPRRTHRITHGTILETILETKKRRRQTFLRIATVELARITKARRFLKQCDSPSMNMHVGSGRQFRHR